MESMPNFSSSTTIDLSSAQREGIKCKGLTLSAKTEGEGAVEALAALGGESQVNMKHINERHGAKLVASCNCSFSLLTLGIIDKTAKDVEVPEGCILSEESGTMSPLAIKVGSAWLANASEEKKELRRTELSCPVKRKEWYACWCKRRDLDCKC